LQLLLKQRLLLLHLCVLGDQELHQRAHLVGIAVHLRQLQVGFGEGVREAVAGGHMGMHQLQDGGGFVEELDAGLVQIFLAEVALEGRDCRFRLRSGFALAEPDVDPDDNASKDADGDQGDQIKLERELRHTPHRASKSKRKHDAFNGQENTAPAGSGRRIDPRPTSQLSQATGKSLTTR